MAEDASMIKQEESIKYLSREKEYDARRWEFEVLLPLENVYYRTTLLPLAPPCIPQNSLGFFFFFLGQISKQVFSMETHI